MSATRAIVFDIYRTLIEIDTDEESLQPYQFLSRWLSYHGVESDALALRVRYLELCAKEIAASSELYPDFDIGKIFSGILRQSRQPDLDVAALSKDLSLLFRILTTRSIAVYPGVLELLRSLHGRSILGIVSNAQRSFTFPELSKLNLIGFFDPIVLSSDVGVRKPDPKIFQVLLQSLSLPAEDVVFIGDNIFDDIYGASRAGMKTIWLNRGSRYGDEMTSSSIRADYVVEGGSMETLSAILSRLLPR